MELYIVDKWFSEGDKVWVSIAGANGRGTVLRKQAHEVLVRVLGRKLPFQKHDGKRWSCTLTETAR